MKNILKFLKSLIKKKSPLNAQQASMVQRIGEFVTMDARSVMVPRVDVVAIDDSLPLQEIVKHMANSIHSRFPVYHETIDTIVGVLYIKDVIREMEDIAQAKLGSLLRQPFFVPETIHLDTLLHEMQRRRMHMAIAVDEYGGVSGIVCMEDIIEEIVGEIRDEFDNETEECIKIDDTTYLIDGRMSILKCNEELSISLPDDDYDTVGGFVYHLFGKIPFRYEQAEKVFGDKTIRFIVNAMAGNKIKSIKIEIVKGNKIKSTFNSTS